MGVLLTESRSPCVRQVFRVKPCVDRCCHFLLASAAEFEAALQQPGHGRHPRQLDKVEGRRNGVSESFGTENIALRRNCASHTMRSTATGSIQIQTNFVSKHC